MRATALPSHIHARGQRLDHVHASAVLVIGQWRGSALGFVAAIDDRDVQEPLRVQAQAHAW
jgi:hypothetical protein